MHPNMKGHQDAHPDRTCRLSGFERSHRLTCDVFSIGHTMSDVPENLNVGRSDQIKVIPHLFQPHQANQFFEGILQIPIDEPGSTNQVTLPHTCLHRSLGPEREGTTAP